VALVVKKDTGEKFALKSLNKKELVARYQVEATKTERDILKAQHPFLVTMHWAFQSPQCVHIVLDYMSGGDLYHRMEAEGQLPLFRARLYAAEITLALGHLHDVAELIYRDMKPDNVLLDRGGHAVLADFGLSKLAEKTNNTFCGTADYIAPEVVQSMPRDKGCDWWGLGVLLYEMIAGETPFAHDNHMLVQRNILKKEIEYPDEWETDCKGFIAALLNRDVAARLGAGPSGTANVKAAPFFAPIDFSAVEARQVTAGWMPPQEGVMMSGDDEEDLSAVPAIPWEADEELMELSGDKEVEADLFHGFSFRRSMRTD